jgi:hypothetical protein
MRLFLIVLSMGISGAAHAQDRQQTPFEQALSAKLFQEINSSLSCAVTQLAVQRELDAAKARIKELEGQAAPK